ncbi:hypothetical protein ACWDO0_27350 [Nocardia rhamnosiphila]|uniref:Uncharacterized protein n=1 Tax=Nocardia rhamnosiphila TaxID=426716 RepID=A0ABV2WL99_9NOCA|nr:hypothetical protein [Nocardia zapadnayensis]
MLETTPVVLAPAADALIGVVSRVVAVQVKPDVVSWGSLRKET